MYLTTQRFNNLLNKVGQDFGWRQATACPCVNPASGAANPACIFCHGKKVIWAAEVSATIGSQGQTQNKTFAQFGTWESGDLTLTIGADSPAYAAGEYDRFRNKNATIPFSVVRIQGETDYLFGTIVSFSGVFWLSEDGTEQIQGGIPVIDANGNLTWPEGQTPPPADQPYSITGIKYAEFFSYPAVPNSRNQQHGTALPRKLLARRFDLFGR